MSMVEGALLRRLADRTIAKVARRVIAKLQTLDADHMMSPDDLGLGNVWDEICYQAQTGESMYWDLYLGVGREMIAGELEKEDVEDLKSVWLQTPEGESWLDSVWEQDEKGRITPDLVPIDEVSITAFVLQHLLARAGDYTNARIRAALEMG